MQNRQTGLLVLLITLSSACSTGLKSSQTLIEAPAGPDLSYQRRVLHPSSFEISDVRAIFLTPAAPSPASLEKCDFDYNVELNLARNREELFMTMPEHVRDNPERWHWCFYAKMLALEDDLAKDLYVDEREVLLTRRYLFFVHLARIFQADFQDSRYLEFATHNYKRLKSLYFRN